MWRVPRAGGDAGRQIRGRRLHLVQFPGPVKPEWYDALVETFAVTLAWTDVPGPTMGNAFVNNLDLEVIVGGQTYKGNLFMGANSMTGGAADTPGTTSRRCFCRLVLQARSPSG